ncbi:MAG: glycosyltransferase, partial [Candidatus Shapirobacteria bacterium]|nr:glycosyltransferase [Candidatus Shapirobacteria bacterium]
MKKYKFSIIIPVRIETDYLRETLKYLSTQNYKSFEILVITDKVSHSPNPAIKRNLGAKKAKGDYLAFLDDDSYPDSNWLKNALIQLSKSAKIAAVCGPCLTPPSDNPRRQASGLVWSSYLGSGGAGTYRNQVSSPRFVDDFPSVNLIVKKSSFFAVGGFDIHHWPGEDTILCLDLVHKLKQQIDYHPSIMVYHHRREVISAHLKQITRYALHRGNFARIYPQTSLKIGYLLPSLFIIYLFSLIF